MSQCKGKSLGTALGILLVLAIIAGFVWLIVRGIEKNPSLVGSLATAASAVIAVVVGRHLDRTRELRQRHREHMEPIYRQLVERLRTAEEKPPDEMVKFFQDLSINLIMFAPADLIKAWIELTRYPWGSNVPDPDAFLLYEQVLREIRKDLGHNDSNLGPGDLQRLYVTDIDTVLGPFRPRRTNRLAPLPTAGTAAGQPDH